MPDYTLCLRSDCPSRGKCWRFITPPFDQGQAYFAEPYPPIVDGKCEQFIDNERRLTAILNQLGVKGERQ